eukprot:364183-Chlamydomonas_euryale.AAC.10
MLFPLYLCVNSSICLGDFLPAIWIKMQMPHQKHPDLFHDILYSAFNSLQLGAVAHTTASSGLPFYHAISNVMCDWVLYMTLYQPPVLGIPTYLIFVSTGLTLGCSAAVSCWMQYLVGHQAGACSSVKPFSSVRSLGMPLALGVLQNSF